MVPTIDSWNLITFQPLPSAVWILALIRHSSCSNLSFRSDQIIKPHHADKVPNKVIRAQTKVKEEINALLTLMV